jgi:thymidine kinase
MTQQKKALYPIELFQIQNLAKDLLNIAEKIKEVNTICGTRILTCTKIKKSWLSTHSNYRTLYGVDN